MMFNLCLVEGDNRRKPYSRLYSTMYSSSGIAAKNINLQFENSSAVVAEQPKALSQIQVEIIPLVPGLNPARGYDIECSN